LGESPFGGDSPNDDSKNKNMKQQKHFYIFSNGRIAKINKGNGEIVWEVKLKEHGMSYVTIGSLKVEDDKIYFGAYGKLICLKEIDGSLIWKNDLKGWGYSHVIFGNAHTDEMMATANQAAVVAATS
jgi:outer membrane protein assembly factor BamB